jgi:putative membrane protein
MNKNLKLGLITGGVIIAILIIVSSVLLSFNGGRSGYWGMMGPGMMGGFGFGWLMPAGIIVFWGLIIWGVVALVRFSISTAGNCTSPRTGLAIEVLKTRYAHGEISKQEYEEKKRDLA